MTGMRNKPWASPLYVLYLAGAMAAMFAVYLWLAPGGHTAPQAQTEGELAIIPPKAMPVAPSVLRSSQGFGRIRVGIIAGHAGFDSGAVCDDGLTEVSVNTSIAGLVVNRLQREGIATDLLKEFDPRLEGYVATALVSIHADSCIYPEATGFKVASLEGSTNAANRSLVDCLTRHYAERTGLPFHEHSITYDMTQYHAFNEIAPLTAGAIIEVGFMLADRVFLTTQPELAADGITEGIQCFIREQRLQAQ